MPTPIRGRALSPWAYCGTTTQLAGLYPFVAGSGAPRAGVPIGYHHATGEIVGCDPFAWHHAGLVTNLGIMIIGAPGVGKTALAKRIARGLMACGVTVLVLGDPKGEYVPIVAAAGGQVIRLGQGLDRINPLDAGPWTHPTTLSHPHSADHADDQSGRRLAATIRAHRLTTVLALCALQRGRAVADWEAAVLGAALDILTGTRPDHHEGIVGGGVGTGHAGAIGSAQPTVPDVLTVIAQAPAPLITAAQVDPARFADETTPLRRTLHGLLDGPLQGVFDGPTTTPIDLNAPAVVIDLSATTTTALTAAGMLTAWSHGHALIDHAASSAPVAVGASGPGAVQPVRPRRFLVVLDEMWRALRGSSALVEHADALTRIYRHRGVAHLMLTHCLDDLAAADTIADRAKTAGLLERCAITALTATSDRELDAITRQRHLTATERALVSSWSSAATWHPGTGHPGRGHYLLKAGDRPGIPVHMPLIGDEADLYHTDPVALP